MAQRIEEAAMVAQAVQRPELRSLKEVQQSRREFDCRSRHREKMLGLRQALGFEESSVFMQAN